MKINCYYEFPSNDWNTSHYFEQIYKSLKTFCPQYTFNNIDTRTLPERVAPCNGANKYSHAHMIIQNQKTFKYFLVTYWDKMSDIHEGNGWDMKNCVEIITSSGTHSGDILFKPLKVDFTPFSYLTSRIDVDKVINELSYINNRDRVIPKTPMFKGLLYNFREYLKEDDRFDIKKTSEDIVLSHTEYMQHLNQFSINMSLNGAGQICYRDMEILGLGTALFRPKLSSNFYNPLIPDYHYIAVDYDHIKNVEPLEKYYNQLKELMITRWSEVIKDRDFIDKVALNGKKWFDENVPKEKHWKILSKILNFNKLK
tara:strand:- start:1932 stop:2867 length:936 start_codon:yes stop_codon:yes gene_type:complete